MIFIRGKSQFYHNITPIFTMTAFFLGFTIKIKIYLMRQFMRQNDCKHLSLIPYKKLTSQLDNIILLHIATSSFCKPVIQDNFQDI